MVDNVVLFMYSSRACHRHTPCTRLPVGAVAGNFFPRNGYGNNILPAVPFPSVARGDAPWPAPPPFVAPPDPPLHQPRFSPSGARQSGINVSAAGTGCRQSILSSQSIAGEPDWMYFRYHARLWRMQKRNRGGALYLPMRTNECAWRFHQIHLLQRSAGCRNLFPFHLHRGFSLYNFRFHLEGATSFLLCPSDFFARLKNK